MAQTSTSQSLAATAKYCFLKLSQEQFSPIDSSPTDSYHENMPDQKTEHIFVVRKKRAYLNVSITLPNGYTSTEKLSCFLCRS